MKTRSVARLALTTLGLAVLDSTVLAAQHRPARRQPFFAYEVKELPDLGDPFHNTYVFDINDAGQSVGYVLDGQLLWRAVRWDASGAVTDIGGASGAWSIARGISQGGVIGGFHGPTLQTARPVLWVGGNIVPLPDPPQGTGVEVYDVNDALEGVGRGYSTDSFAARWSAGGASALADPYSYAFAVNENGVAVGFATVNGFEKAAMWQGGVLTVLTDLGQSGAKAVEINDGGTIVGHAASPSDGLTHAVYWQSGRIFDLGAFQGVYLSAATDINDHGLIVGDYYLDPVSEVTRAMLMLWTPSGVARDLNELVSPTSGWTLTNATGVNDAGWIIGRGTRSGMSGFRAFVAKPN